MGRYSNCIFASVYYCICVNTIHYETSEKVGAIDVPNDRRVNKKPMPRLRRDSSYLWIYSIYNILVNCNEFRRLNKYI